MEKTNKTKLTFDLDKFLETAKSLGVDIKVNSETPGVYFVDKDGTKTKVDLNDLDLFNSELKKQNRYLMTIDEDATIYSDDYLGDLNYDDLIFYTKFSSKILNILDDFDEWAEDNLSNYEVIWDNVVRKTFWELVDVKKQTVG